MTHPTISGVMLCVYDRGLLLRGPSGIGKSELALRLLDRGHQLISDDALQLEKIGDKVVASAPEVLRGRLNIRELGIINIEYHFGITALRKNHSIDLIIDLLPQEPKKNLDPLPPEYTTHTLLGIEISSVQLTLAPQRELALLIEIAVKQAMQREAGLNMNQAFITDVNNILGQPS